MTVRPLHLLGSAALRQPAKPVAEVSDEIRQLVDDLFETMHALKGIGLAATQVGVLDRVAVVEVEDGEGIVLINPGILQRQDQAVEEEGCLSIPDIYGEVKRAYTVEFEALDRDGRHYRAQAEALKARAIQHEIDHLDGILFLDHLSLVKRRLLLAKWKKLRKGKKGFIHQPSTQPITKE